MPVAVALAARVLTAPTQQGRTSKPTRQIMLTP